MIAGAKTLVAPAYLLLCLLIGGSAQGIWANFILQALAVAILAWAALVREPVATTPAVRSLWLLAAGLAALIVIQLIPLPPGLWSNLPGRETVAQGYELLGIDAPWLLISLAPYATIATAQVLLPPLAMLAAMLRLGVFTDTRLAAALLLGAFASIALGTLQVASGGTGWYLYRFVNLHVATGFFANSNHMATLLLASLPFVAALAAERWARARKANARAVILALGFGAVLLLCVGMVLCDSMAVLLIALPVAAASAALALRWGATAVRRGWVSAGALLGLGAVAAALVTTNALGLERTTSVSSRVAIWSNTSEAVADQLPTGSGLGTFPALYPHYEESDLVDRYYVNHAHNDYLEIALEGGLPAIVLLVLFLVWWARRAIAAWRSPVASVHTKAAVIASAALLLHSLVDFPLRTAALSTVFAMCMALLAFPRSHKEPEQAGELRPARHLTL